MEENFYVWPNFLADVSYQKSSITRTKTDNIHDGTPERLVMFFESVSCAIRSRFTSKSLNNATSFEGTRARLAKGIYISIRIGT